MTAKEYIRNSELLKKSWTNENRDLFLIDYEDLLKVLADFATINCKEQRGICRDELIKKVLMNNQYTKDLASLTVVHAPQPDIEESEVGK